MRFRSLRIDYRAEALQILREEQRDGSSGVFCPRRRNIIRILCGPDSDGDGDDAYGNGNDGGDRQAAMDAQILSEAATATATRAMTIPESQPAWLISQLSASKDSNREKKESDGIVIQPVTPTNNNNCFSCDEKTTFFCAVDEENGNHDNDFAVSWTQKTC